MTLFLRCLLIVFVICTFTFTAGAQRYTIDDFYKIDSIANKAQPKNALLLTEKFYDQAKATGNSQLLIKAVLYKMLFQSYLEENAFDKIIGALREDVATAKQPEKSVLQSLLAELYRNYLDANWYTVSDRTYVQGQTNPDFKFWSVRKLTTEISTNYLASLAEEELLKQTKIDLYDRILLGDKNSRYLRPTLYDFLAHRAISTFINTRYDVSPNTDPTIDFNDPAWFSDAETFAGIKITQRDSLSFQTKALLLFQKLTQFHLSKGQYAALADVNLSRLKYIYQQSNSAEASRNYEQALEQLKLSARQSEIYADILAEQAALAVQAKNPDNDEIRKDLVKAIKLAREALESYPKSLGAENAKKLIDHVTAPQLAIKMKTQLQPNLPEQLHLSYKNIDSIVLRIYKKPVMSSAFVLIGSKDKLINYLNTHQPVKEWTISPPKSADYQLHTLIGSVPGLDPGSYMLVAQNSKAQHNDVIFTGISFSVSNLALRYRAIALQEQEFAVTALGSGLPLKGVVLEMRTRPNASSPEKVITDLNGETRIWSNRFDQVLLHLGKDSLSTEAYDYHYGPEIRQNKVVLFTDRSIYRPGQTIYYKGIFLSEKAGEKSLILPADTVDLTFEDANGDELKEVRHFTNEFGTFQGSFIIPTGKMNGRMQLITDYGSVSVQVEEYKRPSFEVVFDKPDGRYLLNDSIRIKGKTAAFSGYTLSHAQVRYVVYRKMIGSYDYRNPNEYREVQVAMGQTKTNADGNFEIPFLAKAEQPEKQYQFSVNVDVTDENGETRSARTSVNAGRKNLMLSVNMESTLFLAKTDSVSFNLLNLNHERVSGAVKAEWELLRPSRLVNPTLFTAENYTMNRDEFIRLFPHEAYDKEGLMETWPVASLQKVQQLTTINGTGAFYLDKSKLTPGYYRLKFTATNNAGDSVLLVKSLVIYGPEPTVIWHHSQWLVAEETVIQPKGEAVFRVAGLAEKSTGYYEVFYNNKVIEKNWIALSPLQRIIRIRPRENFEDSFAVQFTMTSNGRTYTALTKIVIADPAKQLNIKFLSFRDKLQPGEKEKWKLQISNRYGEKQLAEMVATLYDASLDSFQQMNWNTLLHQPYNYYDSNWKTQINEIKQDDLLWYMRTYRNFNPGLRAYEQLNYYGYNYYGAYNYGYRNYMNQIRTAQPGISELARHKLTELKKGSQYYGVVFDAHGYIIPGAMVKNGKYTAVTNYLGVYTITAKPGDRLTCSFLGYRPTEVKVKTTRRIDLSLRLDQNSLNEVVVRGYGTTQKRSLAASAAVISQEQSFDNALSGKVPGLRGDSELHEVLITDVNRPAAIIPRTNFNETAFFYPQLRTDEKGMINIEFTIPQSLTRYKMMGFAHTKDLSTAFITNELITQKQLAISANAPRFFREGDTIVLSARINNLAGKNLKGTASLELRDALTDKVITIHAAQTRLVQKFELGNKGNQVLKWTLIIPAALNAISYKLVADAGKFSDGEEMTIPVLPNRMLVTETLPLDVRGNSTKTFRLDKLLASAGSGTLQHERLTLEFTSNPVWYAVQALPYLMEYPYECAEQTFSRFFANSFATDIINSNPKIKTVFEQWQQVKNGEALLSKLEKNEELKSVLLQETPWVRAAKGDTERKKRLAVLFEMNRMSDELKNNFRKLEAMQLYDGSFPWFKGMTGDRYITQHIVLGFGQLGQSKLIPGELFTPYQTLINKAIIYLDQQLVKDYKNEKERTGTGYLPLHYLFARSYTNQQNNNADFKKAYAHYLSKLSSSWESGDTYQLAQTALVLWRAGQKATAMKVIALLRQTAQHSDEMGMYWKNNQRGWWWYESPIETQALVIEAFDEVVNDQDAVEEMKIWLLKNKQVNDWKTTKATTAACYALLMRGYNLPAESNTPEIRLGNEPLSEFEQPGTVKEAGTGYHQVIINADRIVPDMGKITVKNTNKGIAWGGLYWQYFEQLDQITPAATGVKIVKQLYKQQQTPNGQVLLALDGTHSLAVGDLLTVRIEISADRDMEYVHLKDMRSAGLAPVNVISSYKYQDGLSYYESTKDASTNFFITYLRKGTYVFEYPLRVTHSGNFSNGITSLQCMYAPEFSTHSQGIRLEVK